MSLVENNLFDGTIDKVKIALSRIQEFERPQGYYVAFSGGKDSIVIKKLVEMSGVKFETHFNLTTVDPPELITYIRNFHKDVIWHRPKYNMKQLIIKNLYPPTRLVRYCCAYLKEGKDQIGGCQSGQMVITGIRWQESSKRKSRKMTEICLKDNTKVFLHPIIDWSDEDVWEFIKKYSLPYCCLYDKGFKRIGCIGCPQATSQKKDLDLYPKIKNMYLSAFKQVMKIRQSKKMNNVAFGTDEYGLMKWWVENKKNTLSDQTVLFD